LKEASLQTNKRRGMVKMLGNNDFIGLPVFFRYFSGNGTDMKLEEDRYDLFINGEHIGQHTLYAEKEDVTDISDFLDLQGFHHVQMDVEGDHILIHCGNKAEADQIEEALRVFITNR
jgi:hypothetical protein